MAVLQLVREILEPILAVAGLLFLVWHVLKRLRRQLGRDKQFEDATDKAIDAYKAIVDNYEFVKKRLRASYEEREKLIKAELADTQDALKAYQYDLEFHQKLAYITQRVLQESAELAPDICFKAYEQSWQCNLGIMKALAAQIKIDPSKLEILASPNASVKPEELEYPYNVIRYSCEQLHSLVPLSLALNVTLEIQLRATELLLEKPNMDPEQAVQKAAKLVEKSPSLFPPTALAAIFETHQSDQS